jgi:hypothetical protein
MELMSSADRAFLTTVENWIQANGELLVLIRFPYAAGSRSYEFFSSAANLLERMHELPARSSVIVWRKPQLPLRGLVDDSFIQRCLREIPGGAEFLLVETTKRVYGKASWFHDTDGQSHAALLEALEDSRGNAVAVGLHPSWFDDGPDAITSYVPDEDGVARAAAY